MQYIYEFMQELEEKGLNVNAWRYPLKGDCYQQESESVATNWHVEIGRMTLSIACGIYNYCDWYGVYPSFELPNNRFKYSHPRTLTAEIAILDKHTMPNHGWVAFDSEYETVKGWQTADEIKYFVDVLLEYAGLEPMFHTPEFMALGLGD